MPRTVAPRSNVIAGAFRVNRPLGQDQLPRDLLLRAPGASFTAARSPASELSRSGDRVGVDDAAGAAGRLVLLARGPADRFDQKPPWRHRHSHVLEVHRAIGGPC